MNNDKNKKIEITKKIYKRESLTNLLNYPNVIMAYDSSDNKSLSENYTSIIENNKKIIKKEFNKYIKNAIICFSVDINQQYNEIKKTHKKDPKMPSNWQTFTLEKNYYNKDYNSIAILTGKKNNLFVIDIDNIDLWNQYLESKNKDEPDTIKVITGNSGIHLYFKWNDDLKNIKSSSKVLFDGFDIKTNGGCIYAPPSMYYNRNFNKVCGYSWKDEKNIFNNEPSELPEWIKKELLNLTKNKKEIKKEIISENNDKDDKNNKNKKNKVNKEITDEQQKIIKHCASFISKKSRENTNIWIVYREICFMYDLGFDEWNEWSKNASNYNFPVLKKAWKYAGRENYQNVNIHTLLNIIKNDTSEKLFHEIKNMFYTNKTWKDEYENYLKNRNENLTKYLDIYDDGEKYKPICINTRYLLNLNQDLKQNNNPKNDNNLFSSLVFDFVSNKQKCLVLHSLMDSGKTQFLIKWINEYFEYNKKNDDDDDNNENTIRILMPTHRQSLAGDLLNNYSKLGIKCYLDKENCSFLDDKIICSLESIPRIFNSHQKVSIPKNKMYYDVIVLDEINSLLRHFSSTTIKDRMTTFLMFFELCRNAKKIICCDGDIHNRSLSFCKYLDPNFMYIKNTFQEEITFHFYEDDIEAFKLFLDKADKENFYIPCSTTEGLHKCNKYISEKFPTRKNNLIFGDMDDSEKKENRNPSVKWLTANNTITTSTTGEGVNFNPKNENTGKYIYHFDKVFGMLGNTITPESYNQMTKRARKIKDNKNMYFCVNRASYNKKNIFTTYQNINNDNIYLEYNKYYGHIDGYDAYIKNLKFNDVESENTKRNFVGFYKLLIEHKGGKFIYYAKTEKHSGIENTHTKINNIINSEYINDWEKINKLLILQNNNENLTEDEKNQLKKVFIYKEMFLFNGEIKELEKYIKENKDKINTDDDKNDDDNSIDGETENSNMYEEFKSFIKLKLSNTNIFKKFISFYDEKNYYHNYDCEKNVYIKKMIDHEDLHEERIFKGIQEIIKLLNIDKISLIKNKKCIIDKFIDILEKNKNNLSLFSDKNINKTEENYFDKKDKNGKNNYSKLLADLNKYFNRFGHNIECKTIDKRKKGEKGKIYMKTFILSCNQILLNIIQRNVINQQLESNHKKIIDDKQLFNILQKSDDEINQIKKKLKNSYDKFSEIPLYLIDTNDIFNTE